MIQTQRYIRKPLYVDAVRITAANFEEIAAWCQGEIQTDEENKGKRFIRVRVQNPKNPRQTKAMVGDWLLYTETGYKVYTVKAFHSAFDPVETTPAPSEEGAAVVEDPIVGDGTLPKYPEPEIVPATPEGIASAVRENEAARAAEHQVTAGDIQRLHEEGKLIHEISDILSISQDQVRDTLRPVPVDPEPAKVEPSAVEGKRVLSPAEQAEMSPEELRDELQSGDVVLAQDIAQP